MQMRVPLSQARRTKAAFNLLNHILCVAAPIQWTLGCHLLFYVTVSPLYS